MSAKRFLVMGAGEVGYHLAESLARDGHKVTVIELDKAKAERIKDQLDITVIQGNGAHRSSLEGAGVAESDLYMAVTSSDEANLIAAVLAEHLGAERSVVRVGSAEEVIIDRRIYEQVFGVDLLLSTQLLTTTRILNTIRGHNTMAVEYLAEGKVQLRKLHLDSDSPLVEKPLKEVDIPKGSLIAAIFRGEEAIIPSGEDRAEPGDDVLILGRADVISTTERLVSRAREEIGRVVIAGGGATAMSIAGILESLEVDVKIIEIERPRAEMLAQRFPDFEVLLGDCTDEALLRSERVGK
ncbi:MAG: NAD-binding protein, partial [Thermoanaerobaculia bacterium]|nr:NAD-binding protein [Thermoanaerobaculia bacterium]